MTKPNVRSGALLAGAVAAATATATLLTSLPGYAQVDEIVVTTRKREENLQDVPIAIETFGRETLQQKDIDNIADLTNISSSLAFDEGATLSDTRVVVRGLSPTRGRQNVAVLVDGIDLSTEAISNSGGGLLLNNRLVDVQRIEVVKGPQLALYGRSAFAGAIQYVTKDPAEEFEAEVLADGNEYDQYSLQGGISGPILGEKLRYRLNGAWWDEDGFYKNSLTGRRLRDDEGFGLALTLKSELTETLTLKFRTEYTDQQIGPSATVFLPYSSERLVPESARSDYTDPNTGAQYKPIFRCFDQLTAFTYNRGRVDPNDPNSARTLDIRNSRLYAPGFTPGGVLYVPPPGSINPDPQLAPFSSPYCETGVAGTIGSTPKVNESDIALGLDPLTGADYPGVDRQLLRFSLVADWDIGKATVTSRTGWLEEDAEERLDSGRFGFAIDAPYVDGNVNIFSSDTDKTTTQFSQELLIRTSLDGPMQVTAGALYWREDVEQQSNSFTGQASGSHCSWSSAFNAPVDLSGSGADTACYGYTERPLIPLVAGGFNYGDGSLYEGIAEYRKPYPIERDTEHRSLFGMLDYAATDALRFTFEGRYSVEDLTVRGPLLYEPGAAGGPGSWNPCGFFFRPCTDAFLFAPPTSVQNTGRPAGFLGGPFWSRARFQEFYDSWNPATLINENNPSLGTLRDLIPAQCRNDPATQARLAAFDATGQDPFDLFNPYCTGTLKRKDSWFSPKITVNYRVNDDINTYVSWSRAQKPGGLATLGVGSSGLDRELQEFEPEIMNVYEIGAKTQWLDRRLVINTAAFFQDYTEKQTLVSVLNRAGDRLVSRTENTCCAEVYGIELDAAWAPEAQFLGGTWFVNGSYTWLDAKYVGALVPNNSFTFIASAGNCSPTALVRGVPDLPGRPAGDPADSVICNVSLDGNQLEDAPRNKFVGSLNYKFALADAMDLVAQADFQWTDKRYIENTNESWVDAYSITNFRLGLQSRRWEVWAYANNVFENDTVYTVINGPGLSSSFILGSGIDVSGAGQPDSDKVVTVELPQFRAAIVPDPRVVGLRARVRFGGR
jgi:outer membrane receptor protein involved in Fe transport